MFYIPNDTAYFNEGRVNLIICLLLTQVLKSQHQRDVFFGGEGGGSDRTYSVTY